MIAELHELVADQVTHSKAAARHVDVAQLPASSRGPGSRVATCL